MRGRNPRLSLKWLLYKKIGPVHPGEILLADVLEPLSQRRFPSFLGVPPNRVNAIVRCQRGITEDTSVLLCRCLGTSTEFWLSLQAQYDLEVARETLEDELEQEVTVIRSADWA